MATYDLTLAQSVYDSFADVPATSAKPTLSEISKDNETQKIREALDSVNGNKEQAAKLLGISRATLYRKLQKYHSSHH